MYKSIFIFLISLLFASCNEDGNQIDHEKIIAKNKETFNLVNSTWNLKTPDLSPAAQNEVAGWNEWQQFVIEINQKPKSNLTAFQLKSKNISAKIDSLQFSIPATLDQPQVRSRMSSLNTKIKMLDTFIHLTDVPQHKIKELIPEINSEITALVSQWEEIIIKRSIPREAGEDYMIQALDTARNANPELMMEKMKTSDSLNQAKKDINNSLFQKKKSLQTQ